MAQARAIHASQPTAATSAPPAASQNIRGQPLVDFHLFANLAPELQDAIWEFSCYSDPVIIPIFINDRKIRFQFREVPAVPALLHATSGARAIGLRHFILVKFEEFDRNPPRPRPRPQQPQNVFQQFHLQLAAAHALQIQILHNQNQNNALTWNIGNLLPHTIPAPPPPPPLPAPASQPQGPNSLVLVPYSAQAVAQSQNTSQNQGAIQPYGNMSPGQQGTQAQGALQAGLQHQALQTFTTGGASQQTTVQSLVQFPSAQSSFGGSFQSTPTGQQSFSQNVAQYQSIYGGSMQSNAVANLQQSLPQNGFQYQSPYGGSFQSTPAGQQNTTQNGSHPHFASQVSTVQVSNPSNSTLTVFAALASSSTAVVLHPTRAQRRLVPAEDDSEDGIYFYVNPGSDYFKLQVGEPTRYYYPTYSITQFPHVLTPVSDEDRQTCLQNLQQAYTVPTPFPDSGRLPDFFANIQHLVLTLELAPCLAPMRSDGFRVWLHRQTTDFCEVIIKSTIAKFPNVKNLDLLVAGDLNRRANDRMVLRHWRYAPIQEENCISFGHAELGLLEMEIRVWMMSEYMGKHGPEGPEVRIVVHVPQHYSQTK